MDTYGFEKIKERMSALWEREIIDRCCAVIPVYKPLGKEWTEEEKIRRYTDPECMMAQCRNSFGCTEFYGDALPIVFPYFGTAGFVQYVGSEPLFKPDTIWLSETLSEPDASQIVYDETAYQKHLDYVKELVKLSGKEFLVSMPDNCGVLDGLAAIRGNENLLMDLLDEPEFVKEAMEKLMEVQKKTIPGFHEAIRENNDGGSCVGWMNLWSPKRISQLQCDFSVMISPDLYKEFVLPELEGAMEWLDYGVYHLDGQEQVRHLDYILSVEGIKMIQWTAVAGQPPTSAFLPVLKKIQQRGKGLLLTLEPWEVEKVMTELSSCGLQIVVTGVQSEQEAKELLKLIEKKTHT